MGEQTESPSTAEYITMWEMALFLEVQNGTLSRWVKQWMVGQDIGVGDGQIDITIKPAESRRAGYNLPVAYALVGRGWKLASDKLTREVILRVVPTDPKPWLVVVGNRGITCYTGLQASEEAAKVLTDGTPDKVLILNLGPTPQPK